MASELLVTILRLVINELGSAFVRAHLDEYDQARRAADLAEELKLAGHKPPGE